MEMQVKIEADELVDQVDTGHTAPPHSWESRAIYPGKEGAGNWLAVVNEPTYPLRVPDKLGLCEMRVAAIEGIDVATLVSLGSGDGSVDADLMKAIQSESVIGHPTRGAMYIPVDISRALLETAIATVEPLAEVPVGVLCDFEEGQQFLAEVLDRHATRPRLFTLLGGTLGNLDQGIRDFFDGLRRLMRPGDTILVDVPLAADGWSVADEPRLKPEAYTVAFRRFLAAGLARHNSSPTRSVVDLESDTAFEEHVALTFRHDPETDAEAITVADRSNGRPVLTFRRYRWEPIQQWLEDHGFRVRCARSSVTSKEEKFGMGVLLLELR